MDRYDRTLNFLTGVSVAFGLLVLLARFQIPFYLYYPKATQTILISDSMDLYLFLVSSFCVPVTAISFWRKERSRSLSLCVIFAAAVLLVLVGEPYGLLILYLTVLGMVPLTKSLGNMWRRVGLQILGFTTILALVEFSSICSWIFASINPYAQFSPLSETTEASLSYALSPLSIPLVLLLLSSWVWIPVIWRVRWNRLQQMSTAVTVAGGRRIIAASLDLLALLAVIVFFYPYAAGQRWIVGVDSIIRYLNPLNEIATLGPSSAVFASIRHGAYVALLYFVKLGTGLDSFSIVKFAPLVLAFCAACAGFLAILRSGWGYRTSVLTAICMLLWLPTTLGIFAGIQANWSAFVLWMLFLSLLFTKTDRHVVLFAAMSLISAGILLLHPWTWGVFLVSLLFAALLSVRTPWRRETAVGLFSALAITAPAGIAGYLLLPGLRNELANTMMLYTYSAYNPTQLLRFGGALLEALRSWSSFLSPALLSGALIGVYGLTYHPDGVAKRYLLAWILTWCIGSILVAPIGYNPASPVASETQLWRIFYVSPLPILLALGVERCLAWSQRLKISEIAESIPVARSQVTVVLAIVGLPSLALFVSPLPEARLLAVLVATGALLLLSFRLPARQLTGIMIAMVLILLIVNAAFRSLYPLLIDPHNLLGRFSD